MKKLIITENGLIGSRESLRKLSMADEASILVISDSHRNPQTLRKILKEFSPFVSALVFCGDGVYDLASCLEDAPEITAFAGGNGDPSDISADAEPYLLEVPDSVVLNAAGKRILISHGHRYGVDFGDSFFIEGAKDNQCDIILHGHTHVARHIHTEENINIICPGSITLPRGGQEKSFCILTIKGNYIDAVFKKINTGGFESWTPGW